HSHMFTNGGTNGVSNGNGSWADFPYYGSEKFWFVEDNTIQGGFGTTAGWVVFIKRRRKVDSRKYLLDTIPNWLRRAGWPQRGMRACQVYDNLFHWTYSFAPSSQRSGSSIRHDNTYEIPNHSPAHTALPYFRELGAAGGDPIAQWGYADGANAWDVNDT